MRIQPYTVHEAEVAVYHAWWDGMPVGGPFSRHLQPGVIDEFRAGLKLVQVEADGGLAGGFGEWRKHGPARVVEADWMVEMSAPFGAALDAEGVALASVLRAGMPVVVVVRFVCAETGLWRVFQFHDCVGVASDAGDEDQKMFRSVRFSAGHLEQFKSGVMPGLEPRLRGVIEWRHLGRCVRCWEYDAETNAWAEDAENVQVLGGEAERYVSLYAVDDGLALSYLAAQSVVAVSGGVAEAAAVGWLDAVAFSVLESSGLTLEPGWVRESYGCAEPLLLPVSGRHWEHPRVVFRFLGRIYATVEAGILAVPALVVGDPELPMDFPIRMGRLVLYPEGGWVVAPGVPVDALLGADGEPVLAADGNFILT